MRLLSSSLISASFARIRFAIVCRSTMNHPFLDRSHTCVKPRKSNDSGFPWPRRFRFVAAYRPNSISRVLSGCSSSANLQNRSRKSSWNRSASEWCSNPITMSSAKRTMTTSPRACRLRSGRSWSAIFLTADAYTAVWRARDGTTSTAGSASCDSGRDRRHMCS